MIKVMFMGMLAGPFGALLVVQSSLTFLGPILPHVGPGMCPVGSSYRTENNSAPFLDQVHHHGTMRCFVWHKDQKAVCHCLTAILNLADDSNQDASS